VTRPVATVCGTQVWPATDDDRLRTFLLSDLHVPMQGGDALDALLALLAEARADARRTRVLVLGDLLEGIVNERQLALHAWPELVDGLRAATRDGVTVTLLHGNRDFMLGARFARATGCRVVAGGLTLTLGGRRTLALHGDELCTNDVPYQRSKRWLRSRAVRALCAAMPLPVAALVGRRARAQSGRTMAAGDQGRFAPVEDAVRAVFAAGFELLVFGHVHTPAQGVLDGGRYFVLPAFDATATFLFCARGEPGFRAVGGRPVPRWGPLAFAPARGSHAEVRAPAAIVPPMTQPEPSATPDEDDQGPTEVVAIDGPSGAGKSTVARQLAQRLGYAFLDTGAMYRAVTWLFLENQHNDLSDEATTRALLADLDLDLRPGGTVLVNGRDVTAHLRSREVESRVSAVSALPEVRARMRALQRAIARRGPVVAEGRDMTSVVFPAARWKFFLDAEPEVRARRRYLEVRGKGREVTEADVLEELAVRDRLDSTRRDAPLTRTPQAHYIDTTDLSVEQTVDLLLATIRGERA